MIIISLSAFAPRSGKDTLADLIEKEYSHLNIKRIAFADKLKEEVKEILDVKFEGYIITPMFRFDDINKDKEYSSFAPAFVDNVLYSKFLTEIQGLPKHRSMSHRNHLQLYGNDFVKGYLGREKHWIKIVKKQIKQWESEGVDIVLVTDTRAVKEYKMLRKLGATQVIINNDRATLGENPHPIELEVRDFKESIVINNPEGKPSMMLTQLINTGVFNKCQNS